MNKLWDIQTKKYVSGIKRNRLSSHKKTQRKFTCIFLKEANLKRFHTV